MSLFWQRLVTALGVLAVTIVAVKLVDWRIISKRSLDPSVATRYRVLRRTLMAAIAFVGILSALLVIPQVRTVAGGVLASSAVIGLVIGFASQRTIGNVVAGVLIAVSQPLRLGDEVEVEGTRGVVEEIGITYTWIRTRDNDRLVVPNERLASEPIRNSTIRSAESYTEASIEVPSANLQATVKALEGDGDEVYVTALTGDKATVTVRRRVPAEGLADRETSDLRIALAQRLEALS
jgi:small-conductance mechanosensitive channel